MAVVFISPKQRQKMFLLAIAVTFSVIIIIIFAIVFLAQPKEVAPVLVFNKPKINIDIKIFDTDEFKSLLPFSKMQTEYSYTATDRNKRIQTGFILADSTDAAEEILTSMGLDALTIEKAELGRDNPFSPYDASTNGSINNDQNLE